MPELNCPDTWAALHSDAVQIDRQGDTATVSVKYPDAGAIAAGLRINESYIHLMWNDLEFRMDRDPTGRTWNAACWRRYVDDNGMSAAAKLLADSMPIALGDSRQAAALGALKAMLT